MSRRYFEEYGEDRRMVRQKAPTYAYATAIISSFLVFALCITILLLLDVMDSQPFALALGLCWLASVVLGLAWPRGRGAGDSGLAASSAYIS